MAAVNWVVALCLMAGCSRASGSGSSQVEPTPEKGQAHSETGSGVETLTTAQVPSDATWPELIRKGSYDEAHAALKALGHSERSRLEVRLAAGLVALQVEDFPAAEQALSDVARSFPLQSEVIEAGHARAALEAGPYEVAVQYYSRRQDPVSQGRAALATLRSGDANKALPLAQHAVALAQAAERKKQRGAHQKHSEARHIRAQVAAALKQGTLLREDLAWILTQDPLGDHAAAAEQAFVESKLPALDKAARMKRADRFSDAGDVVATERELQAYASAPGAVTDPLMPDRLRAWAHYNSRDSYAKAAELFASLAQRDATHPTKYRFYAARSTSRAGRDPEAIALYQQLIASAPASRYAEEARYLVARLHYILAEWGPAEQAYTSYLARHGKKGGKGRFVESCRYELAVTRLAAGKYAQAAADFAALVQRERDITEQARLRELQAAALASYAPEQAKRLLQQVMRDWPLSLPALFAAERLRALAAALPPPPIDDSTPPAPLVLALPPKAALYQRIGFDELAAEALAGDERGLSKRYEPRGTEAVCGLYGLLAVAEQRYRWGRNKLLPSAFVEHPRASNRWAWECVYPRPYGPLVADLAQRFSLDPSLLYAVMRRESAFRIDAVSSVGARGLMQLMPATARRVAQDAALPEPEGLLSSPARNIELGARYLQVLARIFAGTTPLMIASYNAGPKAVSQWLEHGETLPLDVWVARIPYRETRHYVLHVMTNWLRYRELAGENLPALALELPQGLRAPADAY